MSVALGSVQSLRPLELLVEAPGLPAFELPEVLTRVYGGRLGFSGPQLYASFVASVDGVVAIPSLHQSSHLIAVGSAHDHYQLASRANAGRSRDWMEVSHAQ